MEFLDSCFVSISINFDNPELLNELEKLEKFNAKKVQIKSGQIGHFWPKLVKLTHVIEPKSNVFHQQYKFTSRVLIDFIVAEKAQRKNIQLPICERWAPNHPN